MKSLGKRIIFSPFLPILLYSVLSVKNIFLLGVAEEDFSSIKNQDYRLKIDDSGKVIHCDDFKIKTPLFLTSPCPPVLSTSSGMPILILSQTSALPSLIMRKWESILRSFLSIEIVVIERIFCFLLGIICIATFFKLSNNILGAKSALLSSMLVSTDTLFVVTSSTLTLPYFPFFVLTHIASLYFYLRSRETDKYYFFFLLSYFMCIISHAVILATLPIYIISEFFFKKKQILKRIALLLSISLISLVPSFIYAVQTNLSQTYRMYTLGERFFSILSPENFLSNIFENIKRIFGYSIYSVAPPSAIEITQEKFVIFSKYLKIYSLLLLSIFGFVFGCKKKEVSFIFMFAVTLIIGLSFFRVRTFFPFMVSPLVYLVSSNVKKISTIACIATVVTTSTILFNLKKMVLEPTGESYYIQKQKEVVKFLLREKKEVTDLHSLIPFGMISDGKLAVKNYLDMAISEKNLGRIFLVENKSLFVTIDKHIYIIDEVLSRIGFQRTVLLRVQSGSVNYIIFKIERVGVDF